MTFKKVFGLLLILIILAAGGIYLLMIEKADDDRIRMRRFMSPDTEEW